MANGFPDTRRVKVNWCNILGFFGPISSTFCLPFFWRTAWMSLVWHLQLVDVSFAVRKRESTPRCGNATQATRCSHPRLARNVSLFLTSGHTKESENAQPYQLLTSMCVHYFINKNNLKNCQLWKKCPSCTSLSTRIALFGQLQQTIFSLFMTINWNSADFPLNSTRTTEAHTNIQTRHIQRREVHELLSSCNKVKFPSQTATLLWPWQTF